MCLSGAHAHRVHSLHNLSFVKGETKTGDPEQHRNAKVPEGDIRVLALIDFFNLAGKRKGPKSARAACPTPPPTSPSPQPS